MTLLTPAETAQQLRVSPRTVRRWLVEGRLVGVRLPSGRWRVPVEALPDLTAASGGQEGAPKLD